VKTKHGRRPSKEKVIESAELEHEHEQEQIEPFCITKLDMAIPRGQLIAICGPVGSGSES
jgi:ABC-type transporter Mla maintaining outer membrane lipid asymmetry ATPase subunit MlaF